MKWVVAWMVVAVASALSSAASAEDAKSYKTELACGGAQFVIELSCPPVNAKSPWDCSVASLHVGPSVGLTGDSLGLPKGHVPAGWVCHIEGAQGTVLLYSRTADTCDDCESQIWISPSGHILSDQEVTAGIIIDPSDDNYIWLNRPGATGDAAKKP